MESAWKKVRTRLEESLAKAGKKAGPAPEAKE
jgi:hypothetical protein